MHHTTMKTTLTLWLDDGIKRKAKVLAQRRRISVSQLFAELIEREDRRTHDHLKALVGIWADRDIDLKEIREKAWRGY